MMKHLFLALTLVCSPLVGASNIEVYKFESKDREEIYKELTEELRCLVCQNQNIADSNAELAQDMRAKTYQLIKSGKSKAEIADYMSERYGDFVLYKPPFKASTAVLWIAPFLVFLLGVFLMLRSIRQRRSENEEKTLDNSKLQEASRLLGDTSDKDKS